MRSIAANALVAVAVEGAGDAFDHAGLQRVGAAEFANPLLIFARGQVAGSSRAVLHFSAGREPEALLRAFVCLLLGHDRGSKPIGVGFWWNPPMYRFAGGEERVPRAIRGLQNSACLPELPHFKATPSGLVGDGRFRYYSAVFSGWFCICGSSRNGLA